MRMSDGLYAWIEVVLMIDDPGFRCGSAALVIQNMA